MRFVMNVWPHPERFKPPSGFGLRQPSAAFLRHDRGCQSGRGLPQSKTLSRQAFLPLRGERAGVSAVVIFPN